MKGSNVENVKPVAGHESSASGIVSFFCLTLRMIRAFVDFAAIALLSAMVALILFQVLGRYVFNYSISWSEEAATFVQVWLVMLGAGIAMRNRHHVGIDLLIVRCPVAVQQVIKAAGFLLSAWLLIVIIVGSFGLISIGMIVKSAALQLPMAVPYYALPIGMTYFLLELAVAILPEIHDPTRATGKIGADFE